MRALTTGELLQFWENGLRLDPVDRALSLLAVACPETPTEALAKLPLGQRDSRLLTLREWTFGQRMESIVSCPQCSQRVELNFDVADVRSGSNVPLEETIVLHMEGYELNIRVPNSEDVAALKTDPVVEQKRRTLFRRCLVKASGNGQPELQDQTREERGSHAVLGSSKAAIAETPRNALPAFSERTLNYVAARLAEADPQADVQLNVCCPFCGKTWDVAFDITSFFWNEIEAWACRVLQEVHMLAGAYGWTEREVLGLSPTRRQMYLEMVSA